MIKKYFAFKIEFVLNNCIKPTISNLIHYSFFLQYAQIFSFLKSSSFLYNFQRLLNENDILWSTFKFTANWLMYIMAPQTVEQSQALLHRCENKSLSITTTTLNPVTQSGEQEVNGNEAGFIIGAVFGGLFIIVVAIGITFLFRRYLQKNK